MEVPLLVNDLVTDWLEHHLTIMPGGAVAHSWVCVSPAFLQSVLDFPIVEYKWVGCRC